MVDAAHNVATTFDFRKKFRRVTNKKARVDAAPIWLTSRLEKGEPLPTVDIAGGETSRLVKKLLVCVVVQMKRELFTELVKMIG